ncbi:bacteriocin biosynthesis cyclodehydratase domain-containing protein [Isoptericola variabilis J7]|uniref:thiamine biosynthesis protein ThiF n=1 Tax=Isoptericola variabilis TaxID=139208 RepID=UPI0011A07159|nr:thiamine biosynthesis protein ThiF [Isoptericola variabilis]TWH32012.1 bacteriocin biosynthesis cyclodehydratase domain-containing protein [Isoptericola variabilis J7]
MTEAMTQARAEVRLRPGTAVLDRGDGEVQLGTDHRWALVVAGLSDAEASWLCEAAARRHRSLEQTARRWAVEDARRAEVLELLERSGFLVGPPPPAGRITAPADGAADAAVLGALRPDGAGQVTLAARSRRTFGAPGYRRDDVGTPRERALTELLAERHPRTDVVHEVDGREPDAVVVVEPDVADPDRYGRLLGDGVPHLPVVVREADVVVGPLVLPGRSACVRCAHRHVADADARWPRLVQQLRGREPDRPQETTLAANAAALAAGQVLALLDGARPAAVGAALEVALPEAVPRVRPVQPHPGCGCTGLVPAG